MDVMRRSLIIGGAFGLSGGLTGCITQALREPNSYNETVSAALISKDGKKLVIITKAFHYIFDAPDVIVKTLSSDFHSDVNAWLGYFYVDSSGNVSGNYVLSLDKDVPDSENDAAISVGFKKDRDGFLSASGNLDGTRYESNGIQPDVAYYKLNKEYSVTVKVEQSKNEKAVKSLLTPITVAADGVLTLVAVPLLLTGFIVMCSVKKCQK